jgi:8-oxo-dGTP pyrophosphatase MutT (NUDIX family)
VNDQAEDAPGNSRPGLTGPRLADRPERWPVTSTEVVHSTGRVISIRRDVVQPANGGGEFTRDVVVHPGAVAIVALDDSERVLLVSQYRHPVGQRLLEIPAGLLDVAGEPYHEAAARELYEEGHVRAREWRVLIDTFSSPGMTSEALRVYLARDLQAVPAPDRHIGHDEEADMPVVWAALPDIVRAALAGDLHNAVLCAGVLAAWAARNGDGYDALRPVDAPWPTAP